MNPSPSTPNRDQIEFWNGPRGATWVAEQEMRDRALVPFSDAAMQAARAGLGERVVDVGCGCGSTTLELGRAVGPRGDVLGIDVSQPMLARARERGAGLAQVRFELADASTYPFTGDAALLFSRFGVMFFDDALAAFRNLRKALAPGGRLAFVCWRGLAENQWMSVPYAAVRQALSASLPSSSPDAPGPLSLADPDRVRRILDGSGFREVALAPFDHPMPLGDGRGIEAAAADAATMGPAARLLTDFDDAARSRAVAAIHRALEPHAQGNEVHLAAATWVVTARAASV